MDFKWIGLKVNCYTDNPLLQKGYYDYYTSFTYNDEEFRVGEFAVFKQQNKTDLTSIGRLLCVFESPEGDSKYNCVVRLYTWARNLQHKFNCIGVKFDESNEIVEESSSLDTILSLQNIKKKVNVVCATLNEPTYLIKKYKLNQNLYFSCRYKIKNDQLVPYFSEENTDDYIVSSELNSMDGKLVNSMNNLTIINDMSSTTPIKRSPIKYNKRSSTVPIINLDSEGSGDENEYAEKIRSPLNPSKNLKLSPKNGERKLKGNLSVKRVLNGSFEAYPTSPSGIPIFSYTIVNFNQEDTLKLKLTKNLRVFPTKLDDELVHTKSPVKIGDIREINNCVEIKTKISDLDSPYQLRSGTPAQINSTRRRSSRTIPRQSYAEYYSPKDEDTPKKRVRRGSTDSHHSFKTPIKENIDSKITTSLCIIDEDEDVTKNEDKKLIPVDSKNEIISKLKQEMMEKLIINDGEDKENKKLLTPRSKRNVGPPQRYKSNTEDLTPKLTPRSTRNSKKHTDEDKNTNSAELKSNKGRPNNSESVSKNRLTRSVGRPKRYNDDDDDDDGNKNTRSAKLKRSVGRPKKYIETDDSASEDETNKIIKSQIKKNSCKTPSSTVKKTDDTLRKGVLKKLIYYEESEGEDNLEPKTPKTQKQIRTPKSKGKDTPTARARMIREGIITPSVQARNKAVVKDNTPLSKARTQLHVSFVLKSLPCRENEYADIINFLEGKLLDGCGGCMYVSGVPGTGKTATVTEVIRSLQKSVETAELPPFKYVNVNGMKLSEPRQSYVEIVRQLTGKTVHWEQAQTILENRFTKSQKKSTPIILVVDELDILCTKRQDVVYNLLDWPTKAKNAQLIVITIANTMDLPERLLMGRVTSRLGLTRLTFQAYTHKQLQEIVSKRLAGISAFNPDAIQLVARKVASVSGDARRALDICRRAVEIAELEGKDALVSMVHVNQALNAMITQPKVQAIKRCSRLEKLLLQAVVAEVERTGVEVTNFSSILKMLVPIAALDGFQMVSNTIAMAAVSKLGACRLLLTDQKHNDIYQKVILNVSADDVYYALTKTDL